MRLSTLTPVLQPNNHSAHIYVPGLSICAAGPAGEQPGPALALEVPLTSPGLHSPSQAKMRLSRSPKVYSIGVYNPIPKTSKERWEGCCGRGERREASGRRRWAGPLLSPQAVLVHPTPSFPTSMPFLVFLLPGNPPQL